MRSQALDGYRLLLESAIAGLFFAIVARLIVYVTALAFPCVPNCWFRVAPNYPYLGTAVGSALLGFSVAYPINRIAQALGQTAAKTQKYAIERFGSQIHILLQAAANEEKPITFTLDNRKVYIGIVTGAPSLRPTDTSLSIIPWLSGYREPDTLNLIFTVNYLRVYQEQQLDPRDFVLVVPLSSIRMAGFFDPSVYPSFIVEEEDGPDESTQPMLSLAAE